MALPLANSFEGGTAGVTISSANSGGASGDAFNTTSIAAGSTLTFDNTVAAHGAISAKFVQAGTPGNVALRWTSSIGSSLTELWGRFYFQVPALGVQGPRLLRLYNTALTSQASIQLNSNGALQIIGSGVNGDSTSFATPHVIDTMYRVEWHWVAGSPGTFELWTYEGDSQTQFAHADDTAINMGTDTDEIWFGLHNGVPASYTIFMDTFLVTSVVPQYIRPSAFSNDGAWTDAGGGTGSLHGSIDEVIEDDVDYIQSDLAPSASATRIKLSSGASPGAGTRTFRWRAGKNTTGGATINMKARIYQGGSNTLGAGTLVNEFTRNAVDALTTYTETVSGAITDYTDLYVEFEATQV